MNEIKAVFLDIDNTLLSFDEYVRQAMKKGFEKYGLPPYREEMFPIFSKVNGSLWESIEKSEITFEELLEIRWNRIFQALGITFDGPVFEAYFRSCLFESAIVIEGALELLEHLSKRYPLYVASNGPYLQQENRLRIAGMDTYFRHLFISERIGASKPSREFFDYCFSWLKAEFGQEVPARETVIIGDSLTSDISGGIAYGMKTCYYNPKKRPLPATINPDYEVVSLKQTMQYL